MKQKYLRPIVWIVKLQWQASRLSFAWGIFSSAVAGLRPIAQTYALAKLLASVGAAALQQADARPVYLWLLALLAIELVGQVVTSIDRIARDRFQQKVHLAADQQFFTKIYELSQQQFDDEQFNTKLDRARDSLYQIGRTLDEVYWAASLLTTFIGSMAAIWVIAPTVGGIIILAILPAALLQIRQNRRREAVYRQMEPIDRVAFRTRWMLIDPNFMPEVRLMNAFKKMAAAWRSHTRKSQDIVYKNDKSMLKYDLITEAVQPLVSFGANVYFFKLLLAGSIGLDRFIFLRGMLEQAVASAGSVSLAVRRLHELLINLQNFNEIYDTPPAIPNGSTAVARPLTIEFKRVSFAYPGADRLALDDVSFVITPGSRLALVGENGAGKSTVIKLLLRQYLPVSGTILVNGTDIKDVEIESYYGAISSLSQDFLLIDHLPIRDNLTIGLPGGASDDEIYAATDLVGATEFIQKLPHRLSTRLDNSFDDGSNLSGGQRQRLAVARALLRNGDIMLLDEPTSAIDAKAEYMIFNNIYKSHAGKTTLIVSHRFSTVRRADTIIVMEQGKITERGTHEELLKRGGLYKEMFEAQAEGYK
ncbi:MAG: ABC transporter ATP-binding protein [Candidatus Chaera renei]|uniref:ABC transporter ATP-binding protein n=1 Tax=Candidatus Chaera renei TaxID=2506947 RepID=A0A4Q0AKA1_9BACT|nr:MAG: ABC transporter ATP-binding protein [Candidatus Chaera renei]